MKTSQGSNGQERTKASKVGFIARLAAGNSKFQEPRTKNQEPNPKSQIPLRSWLLEFGSWFLRFRVSRGGWLGRLLTGGAQVDEEFDEGAHLGRLHLLAVSGHVSAAWRAVADLINELIARQARADAAQ